MDKPPKDDKSSHLERRQYKRVNKNFILNYIEKAHPEKRYEITQLKNISMGGLCFVTSHEFPAGTILGIELKTPYLSDTTYLEGEILESHEKVKNTIYETRLQFSSLSSEAEFLLSKIIEFFMNGDKGSYA